MKLAFYGLYKQATVGSSKGDRPSVFNPVGRAKWCVFILLTYADLANMFFCHDFRDAWDKYRTLSKEEAMSNYIDEIRKVYFVYLVFRLSMNILLVCFIF